METRMYLSISFNEVTGEEAEQIIAAVVEIRGSKLGMTVHYDESIGGEEY